MSYPIRAVQAATIAIVGVFALGLVLVASALAEENVPPVAVDDFTTTVQDTPVVIDVLGNDSDSDGGSLSIVAGALARSAILFNNPVLFWECYPVGGGTVLDLSGNGYDGAISGSVVPGDMDGDCGGDNAFEFPSGNGAMVTADAALVPTGDAPRTFLVRFQADLELAGGVGIFGTGTDDVNSGQFSISRDWDNSRLILTVFGGDVLLPLPGGANLGDGNEHTIAVTYADGLATAYLDGVSGTPTAVTVNTQGTVVMLGSVPWTDSNAGDQLRQFAIFDSALAPATIEALHDAIEGSSTALAPAAPTPTPSPTPTGTPTATPTAEPTAEPTEEPTAEPTEEPTAEPTEEPTAEPTEEPTAEPTEEPTAEPTEEPTAEPTEEPTAEPTEEPTAEPTEEPTAEPTEEPTAEPTEEPGGGSGSQSIETTISPSNGLVSSDGFTITYTPNPGFVGTDVFTYTVSDNQGGTDIGLVTVEVTENPEIQANPDNVTVTTNEVLTFDAVANDHVPTELTASITDVTTPANGTATTDGTNIEYTPALDFVGTDTFEYTLESNEGDLSTALVTVIVTPDNLDPVAVDDDATTTMGKPVHIEVIANDSDPDGNDVYISPGQLARGAILRAGPLLHWECLPEDIPTVLYDTSGNGRDGEIGEGVTAGTETGDCDNGTSMTFGGAGGIVTLDAPNLPVGQAPRSALVRYQANFATEPADIPLFGYGQNGTPYAQFTVSRTILGNDKLIFTSWANDLHFELPPGANIADGEEHNIMFVYDGDVTVFAYYDGIPSGEGTLAVPLETIDDTVMLGGSPWGWRSNGDEMRQFAVFPNAISEDDAYLVHAAIEAAVLNKSFTDPLHGTVVEDPDHLGFTYTPDPDYVGPDQFYYSISDGHGGGAIALVTIDVQPGVNALNDTSFTPIDTPVTINVLANDTAQPGAVLTVDSVTQPPFGTVTTDGSTVEFTPQLGWLGIATFSYTVSSDLGGDDTASISINVGGTGDNFPPLAVDDEATTDQDTPVTIDVLANDSDPDNDGIAISQGESAIPGINAFNPSLYWACLPAAGSSTLFDQSGNGVDGTLNGAVAPGALADDCGGGTTMVFPNAGSYVGRTFPGLPQGDAARTVILRYRTDISDPSTIGMFGFGTNEVGNQQFSISRNLTGNANLSFSAWGNDTVVELPVSIADGLEHTIAIVYDGATTITGYVDGVAGTPAALFAPLNTVDSEVILGRTLWGAVGDAAEMRHFAVFDGALSGTDIADIHNIIESVVHDPAFTQGTNGTVTQTSFDTLEYTPNEGFFGVDTFTYTVADGNGGESTATVAVTVEEAETLALVANPDVAETIGDEPVTIDVLANDEADLTATLVIDSVSTPSNGVATTDGVTVEYTANALFDGEDTFTYTVSDGLGNTEVTTVTVTVAPKPNQAPIAVDDSISTPLNTPVQINVLANDSDPDLDDVISLGVPTTAIGTLNSFAPSLYWSCLPETGTTVPDESGNGNDGTITGNVVAGGVAEDCGGATPVFADGSSLIFNSSPGSVPVGGSPRTIVVRFRSDLALASDVGIFGYGTNAIGNGQFSIARTGAGNDRLLFGGWGNDATLLLPGGANIGDGVEHTIAIVYDGATTLTAYLDGVAGTPASLFAALNTVNGQVMLGQTLYGAVSAGAEMRHFAIYPTALDGSSIAAIHSAIEAGGSAAFSQPANGTVTQVGNELLYTPDEDFSGDDTFVYSITDGEGGEDSATVTVTVLGNQAPEAVDDSVTTNQGQNITIDVMANDSDPEDDTISFTPSLNALTTLNGFSPSLYWACLPNSGTTVPDQSGNGNGNDGTMQGNVAAGDLAGDCGGATPVFVDGTALILNNLPSTLPLGADARTIVVRYRTDLAAPANVGLFGYGQNAAPLGQFSIARTAAGNDRLLFASWGNDNILHLPPGTNIADGQEHTLAVTYDGANTIIGWVDGVAGSPTTIAQLDTQNAQAMLGQTLYGAVSSGAEMRHFAIYNGVLDATQLGEIHAAIDAGGATAWTQPSNGFVTMDGNSLVYDPNVGFVGTDSFTYVIQDEDGNVSDPATVTVTVEAVALAPEDDAALTQQDTPVTISVLDNDAGADLDVAGVSNGANGTVTTDGTTVTYTPASGFFGTDTFTVDVTDGAATETTTTTVTVNGVPTGPDQEVETDEETPITVSIIPTITDPEDDELTITSAGPASGGSVVIDGDDVTYTPDNGFGGEDSFQVTIEDPNGGSVTVTITVLVITNEAPLAVDDSVATNSPAAITIDVLANDSDADGDPITFASAITQMNSLSPSLYWTCLPEAGTTVPDESGNGNDGTIQGNVVAGPLAGDCGGAAPVFADGSALIFNSTPGSVPAGDDARTVVVRFRTDLSTPSDVGLFGYGTNAIGLGQFSVVRTATGNDRLWFETWGMGALLMLPPGSDIGDGDEHTIAIAYDGGTTITAYFDGVAGTPATLFAPLDTVNGQVMLGQTLYGAVSAGASMRHFAIYDGELASGDISAIHSAIEAGGSLSYSQGSNGSVARVGNELVYTPDAEFEGFDSFTYTITDGKETATATVTVEVLPPLLEAVDDSAFTQQDTPTTIAVLDNDEGDDLEVAGTTDGANGTVTTDGTTVTYTPASGFFGTDTFTVDVTNGSLTETSTVTVTVNGAPVGPDQDDETTPETPVTVSIVPPVTDPESTALTITSAGPAGSGTVDIVGGDVTYTPGAGFRGTDSFPVTIADEDGGSLTITVTIVVNTPLEANDDSTFTQQDTPVTVSVLDNDEGGALVVDSATDGTNGTVTTDGTTVTYTPDTGFWGVDTFTVTIVDGDETETSTVTVNVNGQPVGDDLDDTTLPETPVTISVVPPVTDPEAGGLTITSAGPAGSGTVTVEDGDVVYTPEPGFVGTDTFEVTIEDEDGGSLTITVTVVVNTPLEANDDSTFTQQDTPVTVSVLDNDEGDAPVVASVSNGVNGTATTDGTTVTYTPNPGFSGTDSVFVYVEDGAEAHVSTLLITVNGAPQGDDLNDTTEPETPVTISIVPPVTDPESTALTITSAGPAGSGTVTIVDGDVVYTPEPGFTGTDTFEVTIEDEDGGSLTITVTVLVHVAVVANDDSTFTQQDTPVTVAVLDNDEGDDLSVIGTGTAANGTVTTDGTTVTYTPDAGFFGTDTFTVTVEDAIGGEPTATSTVTVTVNGAPTGPDIDAGIIQVDTPVTVTVIPPVTDPEGGELTITSAGPAGNGTVTIDGDTVTYTPAPGYTGPDSFEVTIEDEGGGTVTITVTVTVNAPPTATDVELSTIEGVGVGFATGSVVIEPDGDDVAIVDLGTPSNGTVTTDGSAITYTPDTGFFGTDSFLVTVEDTYGAQASFTVTVDVNGAPQGDDIATTTDEDKPVDIDVLAGITDPEDDDLEVVDVTTPSNGTVSVVGGVVTYTPAAGFYGSDAFDVTIEDEAGNSLVITVTVTVTPAPRVILASDVCVAVVNQGGDAGYTSQFWLEAPGTPSFLGITNKADIGTTVPVGTFAGGTELVLSIHVTNTGHVFQTGPAYDNPDNKVHVAVTPGTGDLLYTVGFEDLFNGGDQDFNDAVIDLVAIDCDVEAEDDTAETLQDVAVDIAVLDNDSTENGTLAVTSVVSPANGTVTEANGVLTYTPNASFSGTDTFTYTVENGLGGSATATVTVEVEAAQMVVLAETACIAVRVEQHGVVTYTNRFWLESPGAPQYLGIDNWDVDDQVAVGTFEAGTELILSIHVQNTGHVFKTGPAYRNPDNFMHAHVTPGTGNVLYLVEFEDLYNGGDQDFNDAVLSVLSIDCGVTAQDDTASTDAGDSVDIDVLDNDSTVEGDLEVVSVTNPANGTVEIEDDGEIEYTPNSGFTGTDTFTYTVENGLGGSATATVTVEVEAASGIKQGRMTGGGNYQTGSGNNKVIYNWGFELRCSTGGGHFNFHDEGVRLHINNFTFESMTCTDEPGYDNGKNFDTVTFTGHDSNAQYGNGNNRVAVDIEVVLTDKGNNGKNDTITVVIRRADNGQILSQLNNVKLKGGNHVAHNN